jgi:hypothetical protein
VKKIRFIYSNWEASRLIPAVLIDCRASIPAILNKTGAEIKAYTDVQVAVVTPETLFYRLEAVDGTLAGYLTLLFDGQGTPSVAQFQLRPAFKSQEATISGFISNFIRDGIWKQDKLY